MERVLDHVLGVVSRLGELPRQSQRRAQMPPHENVERRAIPATNASHELAIRHDSIADGTDVIFCGLIP